MQKGMPHYLKANWPAPPHVHALTVSYPESFHDIKADLNLPIAPVFLKQTHSNHCIKANLESLQEADASTTKEANYPLAIKTADCLPILICNQAGNEVAAIHGGWRGLLNGIIENTLSQIDSARDTLMAWTGPAICQRCFEVGKEVRDAFLQRYPNTKSAFKPAKTPNKYLGNLAYIAEIILKKQAVQSVYHANACTFEEENKYYSYRRAKQTGRIISLIWFDRSIT